MIQSTTKGVLHFEDLEPKMFERMYLNILVTDGMYEDIRSYGIKGSDEGVDILCSEKGGTHRHYIQCKRYVCLTKAELIKIVDRIISGYNNYQGQIIKVVTSCDVTKESQEAFEKYAIDKGFDKAFIIGRTLLDSQLHLEKYRLVKERFFGSEINKEELARKKIKDSKNGKSLIQKKLLEPITDNSRDALMDIIKNPSKKFKEKEVILRSIYDDVYPDANADGEPSSWYKSYLHDTYNDGIQIHLDSWKYEKIVINPIGEWLLKSEFDRIHYDGETLQLNVKIIGRIPYYNVVDINEDGDDYFGCPHIYCIFHGHMGPLTEICYEYHDYETGKRILFEKGRRALISEYDFMELKKQLMTSRTGSCHTDEQ
jgi:hypothetical protein